MNTCISIGDNLTRVVHSGDLVNLFKLHEGKELPIGFILLQALVV
jgi:hypothetical protein